MSDHLRDPFPAERAKPSEGTSSPTAPEEPLFLRPLLDMKTLVGLPPSPDVVSVRQIRPVQEHRPAAERSDLRPTIPTQRFAGFRMAPPEATREEGPPRTSEPATREISPLELARELERARLASPHPASPTLLATLPGHPTQSDRPLNVTRDMWLADLFPGEPALPALGAAGRVGLEPGSASTPPGPCLASEASSLGATTGPAFTRAPSHEDGHVVPFRPALPSEFPRARPAPPSRSRVLLAVMTLAAAVLAASFLARPGARTRLAEAVRSVSGPVAQPRPAGATSDAAKGGKTREDAQRAVAASAPVSQEVRGTSEKPAAAAELTAANPLEAQREKDALFAQPERAAQLYVEGRYKEALAEYRMLATFHPEQRVFADFARILRRRLVETCVRTQPHRQAECSQL